MTAVGSDSAGVDEAGEDSAVLVVSAGVFFAGISEFYPVVGEEEMGSEGFSCTVQLSTVVGSS